MSHRDLFAPWALLTEGMQVVQFLLWALLGALSSLSDHNGMGIAIYGLLANIINEHLIKLKIVNVYRVLRNCSLYSIRIHILDYLI